MTSIAIRLILLLSITLFIGTQAMAKERVSVEISGVGLSTAYDSALEKSYFRVDEALTDKLVIRFSVEIPPSVSRGGNLHIDTALYESANGKLGGDFDWRSDNNHSPSPARQEGRFLMQINQATIPLQAKSDTLIIDIVGDNIHESDENFILLVRIASDSADYYELDSSSFHIPDGFLFRIADDDVLPTISIEPGEHKGSETNGVIPITLNLSQLLPGCNANTKCPGGNAYPITVECEFSDPLLANRELLSPCPIVIPSDTQEKFTFNVYAVDDAVRESMESYNLVLKTAKTIDPAKNSNSLDVLTISGDAEVSISIDDNDATGSIPDTGIVNCASDTHDTIVNCDDVASQLPGQDATSDTDSPFGNYDTTLSGCVTDPSTGLMWEQKTNNSQDMHHYNHTFRWYSTNSATNGGNPGGLDNSTPGTSTGQSGPYCGGTMACDTQTFVYFVNQEKLCGFSDWRLPQLYELLTLVNFAPSLDDASPRIDTTALVNTQIPKGVLASYYYWTATPGAAFEDLSWVVDFAASKVELAGETQRVRDLSKLSQKSSGHHVRLVRTAQ